ncbi:hypothetical protein C9J03_09490 [Photobacterium gaetbulicola]|uniref:Uncharacterized protein n=1 Tax=Photobacterium gaetbulicola Gung47 TaxID=658445 RepID=A0A0C5WH08_9GAMM|nr:cadherin repeat domain-containing protein [Photobacterium gaetbulicola]AJR05472.1 hypothetical protein H744_1c0447 [Photobacterium gaetbulicola Gung47]PSU12788.1 hypothetical protein C9J03_09490 [Photobacterium gaetbulicola]
MKMKFKISAVILSLLLFGCGGGGGGSSESNELTKPAEKQDRAALSAQDLSLTFSEQGIAHSLVDHQVGSAVYKISAGEPSDVIRIDPLSGEITILAAGETQVTVVDSSKEYKTSSTTFNVVVEQAENEALELADITIPTIAGEDIILPVFGQRGEVTVEFQPEGLVDFNPETGIIAAKGVPGEVEVILTDRGDRNYREATQSAKITIAALAPDELEFSSQERAYQPGLTLSPLKISGSEGGRLKYELVEEEAEPVITLSEDSGLMTALRVGEAKVKVTQYLGSEFGYTQQEAFFTVLIKLGKRADLTVSDAVVTFDTTTLFSPAVNNNVAPVRYEVVSGNDVIEVDAQTGLLRFLRVGQAEVSAIDDLNTNFAADEHPFTVTVNPAVHPGMDAGELTYTYTEGMSESPRMKGQLGQLTLSGQSDVVSLDGGRLTVLRAGSAKLTAIDDGGHNYLPSAPVPLTVNVLKAPYPEFTVSNVTTTYFPDYCEDVVFEGDVGILRVLPVSSSDSNIAEYDSANACFRLKRSGIANFTVEREESDNFLASEPKRMSVVVNAADSRLMVDGDLVRTFSEGNPTIRPPAIGGGTGNLSFKLLEDKSEQGVIAVDAKTGIITIHSAGHAVVQVTDAGDDKYRPATASFAVTIEKAPNPVTVDYSDAVYMPDGVIAPLIENLKGDIAFKVYQADTSPVTVASDGTVKMRSTGSFHVLFEAAETRNYLSASDYAGAFIDKAAHPGFVVRHDKLEYEPLKKVTLDLPKEYGTRSYSLQSLSSGWVGQYLRVDSNSGELALLDYTPSKFFALQVSEQESEFYKALAPMSASYLSVVPPEKGSATRDLTISGVFTVVGSTIDAYSSPYQATELDFAGATVMQPTIEEVQKLGLGVALSVDVQSAEPIGETGHQYQESVRLYVQRYEGCATTVNVMNLPNLMAQKQAQPFYKGNYCQTGPTNRIVTYTVVDKSLIDRYDFYDGDWNAVQPFVIYRTAEKPSGAGYVEKQLVEWDRFEVKLSRD